MTAGSVAGIMAGVAVSAAVSAWLVFGVIDPAPGIGRPSLPAGVTMAPSLPHIPTTQHTSRRPEGITR